MLIVPTISSRNAANIARPAPLTCTSFFGPLPSRSRSRAPAGEAYESHPSRPPERSPPAAAPATPASRSSRGCRAHRPAATGRGEMIGDMSHRHGAAADDEAGGENEFVETDTATLSDVFVAPRWLRDAGFTAWLLVGVTLLVVGTIALLSLTYTIVLPVLAASVVAAVGAPVVSWLARHRIPRVLGAALLLLTLIVLGVFVVVVVVGGIVGQSSDIAHHLSGAQDKIAGWLGDLGVDPSKAKHATDDAGSAGTSSFKTLLTGVARGISGLTSLVFFLSLAMLSLFFLLKDGPMIRA